MHLGVDSSLALGIGETFIAEPFAAVFGTLGLANVSLEADFSSCRLRNKLFSATCFSSGGFPDGSMNGGIERLECLATKCFLPGTELSLEPSGVVGLQFVIVVLHMGTEDVFAVLLGVETGFSLLDFLCFTTLVGHDFSFGDVTSREALNTVRNVESTIACSLHGSENTVTSGSANKTDIKEGLEWLVVFVSCLLH